MAFYVGDDIIAARAKLLGEIAQELISDGIFDDNRLLLRESRIPLLTNAYFILNLAYKALRLPDDHRTEAAKIAALQCVAIATFQPFRALNQEDVRNIYEYRSSEIFALTYAFGILEVNFKPDTPEKRDLWFRILDIIAASRSQTLEIYVQDINHSIRKPLEDYSHIVLLDDDRLAINSLITIFELLSHKRVRIFGIIPWHMTAREIFKHLFDRKR